MVLQLSLHYTSKMCLHVFELCTGFHIELFNGGEKDAPPPPICSVWEMWFTTAVYCIAGKFCQGKISPEAVQKYCGKDSFPTSSDFI